MRTYPHLSSTTMEMTMKNTAPKDLILLTEIALKHLGVETLTARGSDSLDFHEVSTWGLRAALEAAFAAGQASTALHDAILRGK